MQKHARASGVVIRPGASGGHAEPRYLGTVYLSGGRGRLGGRRGRAASIRLGSGGLGSGGYGSGHGGVGLRSAQGPLIGRGQEEGTRARRRVGADAFAYAAIALPFSGEPAKFIGRPEHVVGEHVDAFADHLSTFAIDVDTAAYAIARRALVSGAMPNPSLVRPEEFLNYFAYDYRPPKLREALFSIEVDGAESPLEPEARDERPHLLRVGLMARPLTGRDRRPANLVFLVDTSCSMTSVDKLELAKKSLSFAVGHLQPEDRVAITTYAGGVRLVLPPTFVRHRERIFAALDELTSSGGTAMGSGLRLAYEQASDMRSPETITRIIVCSDGDANIGLTQPDALLDEVRRYVDEGITLSTIGFGDGNYRDAMMEQLANRGNGNYFYVDSERQAARVFGRDLDKMIQDVAKDVKIQVAFDTAVVRRYRLVGYENRAVADEDFRDDAVDAGEIGAGHQVTALYELELAPHASGRLGTVRVRAKRIGTEVAKETSLTIDTSMVMRPFARAPADLRFAAAVVGAAELLRQGPRAERWSYRQVRSIAGGARPERDPDRQEFLALVERAEALDVTRRGR